MEPLPVAQHVKKLIRILQEAGFESYIAGGAIRDMLLNRVPKDFDISTAATPEEVRAIFGRRSARIIGKRFRLVHVNFGNELFEVSTFRRAPRGSERDELKRNDGNLPENLILSDNDFGTAEEDAWRRDFTVNALFYDPVNPRIVDFTGRGLDDIQHKVVRAIGEPRLRFEEDPVRMLRALKLIGQYDFIMEPTTENALFAQLELLKVASPSRLALELEKILSNSYGDRHLQAMHDYGLLPYFLPNINAAWDTPPCDYALDLLTERNCRVDAGLYRNSISLAMATLALPFVEQACGSEPGRLWTGSPESRTAIEATLAKLFEPQKMMNKMTLSAQRIITLQPLFNAPQARAKVMGSRSYLHARELMLIRTILAGGDAASAAAQWPPTPPPRGGGDEEEQSPLPRRRRRGRRAGGGEESKK